MSIIKPFDYGCTSTFADNNMKLVKQVQIVLEGIHKGTAIMWYVNLVNKTKHIPPPTYPAANRLVNRITKPDMYQLYHTTLFIPVKQTPLQAINIYLTT